MRALQVFGVLVAGLMTLDVPAEAATPYSRQNYRKNNLKYYRKSYRVGGELPRLRRAPRRELFVIELARGRRPKDRRVFGRVYSAGYERGYARSFGRPYARGFGRGELRSEGRSRYTGFARFSGDDSGAVSRIRER